MESKPRAAKQGRRASALSPVGSLSAGQAQQQQPSLGQAGHKSTSTLPTAAVDHVPAARAEGVENTRGVLGFLRSFIGPRRTPAPLAPTAPSPPQPLSHDLFDFGDQRQRDGPDRGTPDPSPRADLPCSKGNLIKGIHRAGDELGGMPLALQDGHGLGRGAAAVYLPATQLDVPGGSLDDQLLLFTQHDLSPQRCSFDDGENVQQGCSDLQAREAVSAIAQQAGEEHETQPASRTAGDAELGNGVASQAPKHIESVPYQCRGHPLTVTTSLLAPARPDSVLVAQSHSSPVHDQQQTLVTALDDQPSSPESVRKPQPRPAQPAARDEPVHAHNPLKHNATRRTTFGGPHLAKGQAHSSFAGTSAPTDSFQTAKASLARAHSTSTTLISHAHTRPNLVPKLTQAHNSDVEHTAGAGLNIGSLLAEVLEVVDDADATRLPQQDGQGPFSGPLLGPAPSPGVSCLRVSGQPAKGCRGPAPGPCGALDPELAGLDHPPAPAASTGLRQAAGQQAQQAFSYAGTVRQREAGSLIARAMSKERNLDQDAGLCHDEQCTASSPLSLAHVDQHAAGAAALDAKQEQWQHKGGEGGTEAAARDVCGMLQLPATQLQQVVASHPDNQCCTAADEGTSGEALGAEQVCAATCGELAWEVLPATALQNVDTVGLQDVDADAEGLGGEQMEQAGCEDSARVVSQPAPLKCSRSLKQSYDMAGIDGSMSLLGSTPFSQQVGSDESLPSGLLGYAVQEGMGVGTQETLLTDSVDPQHIPSAAMQKGVPVRTMDTILPGSPVCQGGLSGAEPLGAEHSEQHCGALVPGPAVPACEELAWRIGEGGKDALETPPRTATHVDKSVADALADVEHMVQTLSTSPMPRSPSRGTAGTVVEEDVQPLHLVPLALFAPEDLPVAGDGGLSLSNSIHCAQPPLLHDASQVTVCNADAAIGTVAVLDAVSDDVQPNGCSNIRAAADGTLQRRSVGNWPLQQPSIGAHQDNMHSKAQTVSAAAAPSGSGQEHHPFDCGRSADQALPGPLQVTPWSYRDAQNQLQSPVQVAPRCDRDPRIRPVSGVNVGSPPGSSVVLGSGRDGVLMGVPEEHIHVQGLAGMQVPQGPHRGLHGTQVTTPGSVYPKYCRHADTPAWPQVPCPSPTAQGAPVASPTAPHVAPASPMAQGASPVSPTGQQVPSASTAAQGAPPPPCTAQQLSPSSPAAAQQAPNPQAHQVGASIAQHVGFRAAQPTAAIDGSGADSASQQGATQSQSERLSIPAKRGRPGMARMSRPSKRRTEAPLGLPNGAHRTEAAQFGQNANPGRLDRSDYCAVQVADGTAGSWNVQSRHNMQRTFGGGATHDFREATRFAREAVAAAPAPLLSLAPVCAPGPACGAPRWQAPAGLQLHGAADEGAGHLPGFATQYEQCLQMETQDGDVVLEAAGVLYLDGCMPEMPQTQPRGTVEMPVEQPQGTAEMPRNMPSASPLPYLGTHRPGSRQSQPQDGDGVPRLDGCVQPVVTVQERQAPHNAPACVVHLDGSTRMPGELQQPACEGASPARAGLSGAKRLEPGSLVGSRRDAELQPLDGRAWHAVQHTKSMPDAQPAMALSNLQQNRTVGPTVLQSSAKGAATVAGGPAAATNAAQAAAAMDPGLCTAVVDVDALLGATSSVMATPAAAGAGTAVEGAVQVPHGQVVGCPVDRVPLAPCDDISAAGADAFLQYVDHQLSSKRTQERKRMEAMNAHELLDYLQASCHVLRKIDSNIGWSCT